MKKPVRGVFITCDEFQGNTIEAIRETEAAAQGIRAVINHEAPAMARDLKKGNSGITDQTIQDVVRAFSVRVVKVDL